MNRIYQGRVTKVETLNGKNAGGQPQELPKSALWQHHELFQDAVNYYLICLLALAGNLCAKQRELRERMTTKPEEGNEEPLYVWERFRRRGAWRRGLRDSVAPYLCPSNADASPEDCFAAVLAGNESAGTEGGRKLLDRGLRQLLDKCTGSSGCKEAAPVFLPRFCKPSYQGSYGGDISTLERENKAARLPFVLHETAVHADSTALDEFRVHSIALPNEKKPKFVGMDAIKKLRGMVKAWRERQPASEPDWVRLETAIARLPIELELPGYSPTSAKNEVKFRLFAMFFFRHVERSEFTLGLLRATTPKPKDDERPPDAMAALAGEGNPIRSARGQRGFVFRAFTSLACWGGGGNGSPQWIQFDFAAFEEALKALHQVDDKAKEREEERNQKLAQHDYQRGKTKKWKGSKTGEEEQRPPVLAGNPRIARLEQLVDVELRAEYEMSEGVELKYGLHPRTIRGFRDVRKKWNEALEPGQGYSGAARDRLWNLLTDYKKENVETIGSPVLFDALVEEANWIIWREPDAATIQQWSKAAKLADGAAFCADPLQALTDERELLADIERLQDPIRLTPADPEHSRRQFYFSDVSDLTKKDRLRHDRCYLDAEIAEKVDAKWTPRWVRIHFGAPRLLRDQLKSDEEGRESAWQQAMMAALGLKAGLVKKEKGKLRPASFAECAAVALMPEVTASGERRILLNFPLTLEDDAVARQLGKAARWDANQFGPNFKNSSWLRWSSTPDANARSRPWWESSEPFRCLPVDLGQRDAGAFALLEITPGNAPKPQSRKAWRCRRQDIRPQ